MTDTTTDAAEARVHHIKCWPDVFEEMRAGRKTAEFRYNDRGYLPGDMLLIREWDTATSTYTHREITRQITHVLDGGFGMPAGYAMLSLATAEAASEAGERGTGWVFWNPDSGEEYAPGHPVESGECCEAEHIRPSTPQEDTLWQAFQDQFVRAEAATAALASLPPATDPAMVEAEQRLRFIAERYGPGTSLDIADTNRPLSLLDYVRAALAAAPTIPATGEAVPEGMKPWHSGDGPPDDWDGGLVLWHVPYGRDYLAPVLDGDDWQRHSDPTGKCSIAAYTPKVTIPATQSDGWTKAGKAWLAAGAPPIPATGHAATEGEGTNA